MLAEHMLYAGSCFLQKPLNAEPLQETELLDAREIGRALLEERCDGLARLR